ncbi:MAG TPA: hypothetical protein VFB00_03990, partial [Terriglobales bacterium]|nr:hypothetical protein [Terriglobales bacterium]
LDHQITALRGDVMTRADRIESDTFTQVSGLRQDANQQLDATRQQVVAEVSKVTTPTGATIEQAQALLPPAARIMANAAETSDLLLDCDHNPDCFANRAIPAMKNVEHMAAAGERAANAVADVTPATAQAVQSTSKDLATITARFAHPVSWVKGAAGTALSFVGKFFGF